MSQARPALVCGLLLLCAGGGAWAGVLPAVTADDRFLAGAASAVLEREFGPRGIVVVVDDRRLQIDPHQLAGHDPEEGRRALDGLVGFEVALGASDTAPRPSRTAGNDSRSRTSSLEQGRGLITGFLPELELFDELLADPREPVISGGVQRYLDDGDLNSAGSASFGGSLPLYGWTAGSGAWQVGIQGGVFSLFDLDRVDLVNSDFLVALPLETRYGDLSARARLFHQSSHLGDEFLIRSEVQRENLSYEGIDLLLARELFDLMRIYGGGSVLLRRSPDDLDRFGLQGGAELRSPAPVLTSITYPIAGLDLQARQETGWHADLSARLGVELRNGVPVGNRIQLFLEYFNGRSPNGQFFRESVEYVGAGVRVLF